MKRSFVIKNVAYFDATPSEKNIEANLCVYYDEYSVNEFFQGYYYPYGFSLGTLFRFFKDNSFSAQDDKVSIYSDSFTKESLESYKKELEGKEGEVVLVILAMYENITSFYPYKDCPEEKIKRRVDRVASMIEDPKEKRLYTLPSFQGTRRLYEDILDEE